MLVLPEQLPGCRVERPDVPVPSRHEHHAVDDEGRRLERVRRGIGDEADDTRLEHPCRTECLDVARVHLIERAIPLSIVGSIVSQPVVRFGAGPHEALRRHLLRDRWGRAFDGGIEARERLRRLRDRMVGNA